MRLAHDALDALDAFLAPGELIDTATPNIVDFVRERLARCDDIEATHRVFIFVRDEVRHSWDAQSRRVTRSASEALRYREGICYPKSHLVAALLRARGIPTALCYQRLTLEDDASAGHAVHALNAVFLRGRWHRIDARGNKLGVDAQFTLGEERLAFTVRPALDERDYLTLYAQPHPAIAAVLASNDDALVMYAKHLPADLDEMRRYETSSS